jgi:hypothetical protein
VIKTRISEADTVRMVTHCYTHYASSRFLESAVYSAVYTEVDFFFKDGTQLFYQAATFLRFLGAKSENQ